MPNIRMNSWIISDTHFGHDNMKKAADRPENHDFIIYDNWLKIVQPRDTIIHLGDLTVWYGMKKRVWESACKDLPGKKYLILGNHDYSSVVNVTDEEYYAALGFKVLPPFIHKIGIFKILFSHYPVDEKEAEWDFNFHGHIHNNEKDSKREEWHRNCSIEMMNYRPVQIGDII